MKAHMSHTHRTLRDDIEARERIRRILERYKRLTDRRKEDKCPETE